MIAHPVRAARAKTPTLSIDREKAENKPKGSLPDALGPRPSRAAMKKSSGERREASNVEGLLPSRAVLSHILNSVTDSIFWKDRDCVYLGCNAAFARGAGLAGPEEIVGKTDLELPWRDQAAAYLADDLEVMESNRPKRYIVEPVPQADGTTLWVDTTKIPLIDETGKVYGVLGTFRDVTEQRVAENALRASEERFRAVVEGQAEIISRIKPDGTLTYVNDILCRFAGKAREELLGTKWQALAVPQDLPAVDEKLRGLSPGNPTVVVEARVFSGSGRQHWMQLVGRGFFDSQGRLSEIQAVGREITEQKEAERALRASEAQLSNALKIARLGTWEYDFASDRFTFNDPFYAIYRTTAEEVGGYTMSSAGYGRRFIHPEDVPIVAAEVQKALETDDRDYGRRLEHRVVYADGEIGHIAVQFGVVKDEQGRTVRTYGVSQDVTERRRLEEQLRQAQKMEAVGRLAGGVAHDFNNILTVIQGYGELLRSEFLADDPRAEQLGEMLRGAERAANLTRQLLAFSRRQVLQPRLIRLGDVAHDLEKMLRRLIGEDVELKIIRQDQGWPVRADSGQIEQVVVNLAVNARDAMPEGGRLTVEVADLTLDRPIPVYGGEVPPGSWVVLSVRDTGCGIDEESLEQLFQPFFTTKEVGKGTGLGLATVWGIVKQSEGFIGVETVLQGGTTFRVYLPRAEGQTSGLRPSVRAAGGTETILVVEDEEPVRKLVCRQLGAAGYAVLAARSADEALRRSRENPGSIQLLLADVVMPKQGGPSLAQTLLEERPGLEILLMSGYTPDLPAYQTAVTSGWRILQKPFSNAVLLQAVREALDG